MLDTRLSKNEYRYRYINASVKKCSREIGIEENPGECDAEVSVIFQLLYIREIKLDQRNLAHVILFPILTPAELTSTATPAPLVFC